MQEVRQDHVRRGVELLVLSEHIPRYEELVALVSDQELVVGIVRVSEHLLAGEVADVGDALHLGRVALADELWQRLDDRGELQAGEDPVSGRHVGGAEDQVRAGRDRVDDGELVGLVVDAGWGSRVPGDHASVSAGAQVVDDLTVLLVLQGVRQGVEQDRLSLDVVHRLQVLVGLLRPDGLQLQDLRSHGRGRELHLVAHDVLVTLRVEDVGHGGRLTVQGAARGDRQCAGDVVDRAAGDVTSCDQVAVAVVCGVVRGDDHLDGAAADRDPAERRGDGARRDGADCLVLDNLVGVGEAVRRALEGTPHRAAGRDLALGAVGHDVDVDDLGDRTSHGLEGDQLVDDVVLGHVGDDREDPLVKGAEGLRARRLGQRSELAAAVLEHDRRVGTLVLRHVFDKLFPALRLPEFVVRGTFFDARGGGGEVVAPLKHLGEARETAAVCRQHRSAICCFDYHGSGFYLS